jgi:hypothetical protein
MAGDFDIMKKRSVGEKVLLGFLVLGLFLSYLMVRQRRQIELSEPVKLDFANFSVAMPTGESWEASEEWQYKTDSSFILWSVFSITGQRDIFVMCRYFMANKEVSGAEHLEADIGREGVQVLEQGRFEGQLEVHWAQIKIAELDNIVFLGYGVLPDGRLLEIETISFMEADPAEGAFKAVVESIEVFEDTGRARTERFIEHLRRIGATELVAAEVGASKRRIYVTAEGEEVEGFMVDEIEFLERGEEQRVKNQRLHYTSNDKVSGNCILECNESIDDFYWDSRHGRKGTTKVSHVRTTLDKNGRMKVDSVSRDMKNVIWPSRRLIPEALLEPAAKAFLDFEAESVIIDVVFSRGIIVPVRISKRDFTELKIKGSEAGRVAYGVRIDFLHQAERYQQIYFDAEKNITGKYEKRGLFIMWERVDSEGLEERYPNWLKEVETVREEVEADV